MNKSFVRFAVVGAVGFCIDAGILTVLQKSGVAIELARCASFLSAVTMTWVLNRNWTFEVKKPIKDRYEYLGYMLVQGSGAAINMGIFLGLISIFPELIEMPIVPLAIGAAVSLIWNFALSKKWFSRIKNDC